MHAVEDPAVKGHQPLGRQPRDAQFGELFLDLASHIMAKRFAGLYRQEAAEIPDRDAVKRIETVAPRLQIIIGLLRRRLDKRIIARLEIEKGVEHIVDERVGECMKLHDRRWRKVNVEQSLQGAMDMGEHIGGRNKFPGVAPAIVDAEKGLLRLVPGHHGQEVGIGVPRDSATQLGKGHAPARAIAQALHGCTLSGVSTSSPGFSRT